MLVLKLLIVDIHGVLFFEVALTLLYRLREPQVKEAVSFVHLLVNSLVKIFYWH